MTRTLESFPSTDSPMSEGFPSSDRLRDCIDRLNQGDDSACAELINHAASRLATLTRRMFRDYDRLGRWVHTDDICQNASLRLWNALKSTRPTTAVEFHRLAALQIRRELIDQVRSFFGPEGMAAHHESNADSASSGHGFPPAYESPESTHDPAKLTRWAEFHERVALLPDDERAVFDLVWYQGLPQAEAAQVLAISERTLKRRWLSARLALGQILDGTPPA
jgi:RNA polymerase sigma-70 factor (ECF subfamily)